MGPKSGQDVGKGTFAVIWVGDTDGLNQKREEDPRPDMLRRESDLVTDR